MEFLLVKKHHVYLTGASGTGKTVIIQSMLTEVSDQYRSIDNF